MVFINTDPEFFAIDNPGFEPFDQDSFMQEELSLHEIILAKELQSRVVNRENLLGRLVTLVIHVH